MIPRHMESVPFAELPARERRRLGVRLILRVLATSVAFVLLYALIPVAGKSGARAIIGLTIGLIVFGAVIIHQVRAILVADHPGLQAVEAVAVSVPLVIVLFAFTYLALSENDPTNFSEPLDHVSAFYFTVTTLATVGYGDITPETPAAQIIVSIQMLLDFLVLVAVLRVVMWAARLGISRKHGTPMDPDY
jgi:hypothetical protein